MRYFERIALGIDTAPVMAALLRQDLLKGANQQWKCRYHLSLTNPPGWLDAHALSIVEAALSRVRIDRLASLAVNILRAGGRAEPHIDQALTKHYAAKFHFVIASEPACLFTAGDETVHMACGELWWFNNQVTHSVINGGLRDRIHLVFEAITPDYPRPVPRGTSEVAA